MVPKGCGTGENGFDNPCRPEKSHQHFFDSQYRISAEAKDLLDQEPARKVVEAFASYLEKQDAGNQNLYAEAVRFAREATGAKGRALFMPVRAALTGLLHGPELDKIFDVLGRNAALRRLKYFER